MRSPPRRGEARSYILRKRPWTAETYSNRGNKSLPGKKPIRDYRNDLFVFLVERGGPRKPTFRTQATYVAAEFIRGPGHAIGRPASIIYLGNYTEAGSTPVAREPQIIERHAFAVSPTTPATEPSGIVKRFLRKLPLSLSLSFSFFLFLDRG